MWKVKRMNTARIVVLTIAVGAGGVAACPASGSDRRPPPEPVAQLQTVDVIVAQADIGLGQTVTPDDMHHPDRRLGQNSVVRPDDGARRGNINAVRDRIANPTTIQK
jgi:Flp pilus assembly protein CpaB